MCETSSHSDLAETHAEVCITGHESTDHVVMTVRHLEMLLMITARSAVLEQGGDGDAALDSACDMVQAITRSRTEHVLVSGDAVITTLRCADGPRRLAGRLSAAMQDIGMTLMARSLVQQENGQAAPAFN